MIFYWTRIWCDMGTFKKKMAAPAPKCLGEVNTVQQVLHVARATCIG